MRGLLQACKAAVLRWRWFLLILNWLFFGSILIGFLLENPILNVFQSYSVPSVFGATNYDFLSMMGTIFFFNLALSGFLFVTCPGIIFFGFSAAALVFRALLWGALLSSLPTFGIFVMFPTLLLESEGYVLAGLAGVVLGLSWLKPHLIFKEGQMSRSQALKRALKECAYIFLLQALVLFVAAIVESITIIAFPTL